MWPLPPTPYSASTLCAPSRQSYGDIYQSVPDLAVERNHGRSVTSPTEPRKTNVWNLPNVIYSTRNITSTLTIICYIDQNSALLGYYAVSSGNYLQTFWDNLSVPSSGVGNDPLNMVPIGCSETSTRNYHYSLRSNPEERSSHPLRGGSLKSRMLYRSFHSVTWSRRNGCVVKIRYCLAVFRANCGLFTTLQEKQL